MNNWMRRRYVFIALISCLNFSALASSTAVNMGGTASGFVTSPTNLSLTHNVRAKTFTVSWTAGIGNGGSGGCRLEYRKNDGSWVTVGSPATVNCDSAGSGVGVVGLPDSNWLGSGSWSSLNVRLVRATDGSVQGTFPQTLNCLAVGGSSVSTPSIDEDCNGAWDNAVAQYTTYSGCNTGYTCAASQNFYMPDPHNSLSSVTASCHAASGSQIRIYSYNASYTQIWVSLPYYVGGGCGSSNCVTEAEIRSSSQCSYSAQTGTTYY